MKKRLIHYIAAFIVILLCASVVYIYISQRKETSDLKNQNSRLYESLEDIKEDISELKNIGRTIPSTTSPSIVKVVEGPQGPQGPQGESGNIPDGGWERYCLVDTEVFGFKVHGVLMRKSGGDCQGGWREVKLWEK